MGKFIDLSGTRFGRLTVMSRTENIGKQSCWIAQCDCGNISIVRSCNLQSGNTNSCGCLMIETCGNRVRTHGLSSHKLFSIHESMKARCNSTLQTKRKDYEGRGITVCDEWENSFICFYKWAIDNGYHKGLSIDRKNNDGNYEPDNCRWATAKEQGNNKRTNHLIEMNGIIKNLCEWAEHTGIGRNTIAERLKRSWSVERALTEPTHMNNSHKRKK